MRELKFRAYNRRLKVWEYFSISPQWLYDDKSFVRDAMLNGEVNQYIGLLDKNLVEIYEGDIVNREYDDLDMLGGYTAEIVGDIIPAIIKWDVFGYYIAASKNKHYQLIGTLGTDGNYDVATLDNVEVIANIYDNPELADTLKEEE